MADSIYPGGLSGGDTPTHMIKTTGAGGARAPIEHRAKDAMQCPFHKDDDIPFSARSRGMYLDVLGPDDVPPGPIQYPKDFDRSLMTSDLSRAQPMLAHPTSGVGEPLAWCTMRKPPLEEVPKSRPFSHYPPVQGGRPRDLSLTTSDIELAQSKRSERNSEGRARLDCMVDPLSPRYQMVTSEAPPPLTTRDAGGSGLDVSDIEGAMPAPAVPVRRHYSETMKCEAEFHSPRLDEALNVAFARSQALAAGTGTMGSLKDAVAQPSHARLCTQPRLEGPKGFRRATDAQDPVYKVPLTRGVPATSIHARWDEERLPMGKEAPPVEHMEIGRVPGSVPCNGIRDNGQPFLSLETRDVPGAGAIHRVGQLPYSLYGPQGNRPNYSSSLHTADIKGAQASTLPRGPRTMLSGSRLTGASIVGIPTPRESARAEQDLAKAIASAQTMASEVTASATSGATLRPEALAEAAA